MVVSLSAHGHLLCSYMGTDPSFFSTPKVDAREADYQQVEAEMRKLQKFIREASRTQGRSKLLQQVFSPYVSAPELALCDVTEGLGLPSVALLWHVPGPAACKHWANKHELVLHGFPEGRI